VVGSFCVANEYVGFDVHDHRVDQFVLNAYCVECNHTHTQSLALLIIKLQDDHSGPLFPGKLNVGAVVSLCICHVFELVVHHTSPILICTVIVHSAGTNQVDKLLALSIHHHPFNEYATDVLADGHTVPVILHVVIDDEFVHV
jgi:metal-dependent HD superfamily phosphatase/phosphodiesterase